MSAYIQSFRLWIPTCKTLFHASYMCWSNTAKIVGRLTEWVRHCPIMAHIHCLVPCSMENRPGNSSSQSSCQTSGRSCWVAWATCEQALHYWNNMSHSCCRNRHQNRLNNHTMMPGAVGEYTLEGVTPHVYVTYKWSSQV